MVASLSGEEQDRCLYVIRSPTLASWVNSPSSTALIVNGNSLRARRRSPLSFICAKLVYSLNQIQPPAPKANNVKVVTLHYFCGEHIGCEDTRNTAPGIANCLLAQLLKQCKGIDLTNVIELEDFDSDDLNVVYECFEHAVAQLTRTTMVFCIIDGLSYYIDDEETESEAQKLFTWLVQLTHRRRYEGHIFKLLVTAPIRLHVSELERLSDDEIIDVPRRLASTGGFKEMKWDLGVGKYLNEF